jgi:hypothetical protein
MSRVAINLAHLLRHDTAYGRYGREMGKRLDVDVMFASTGIFIREAEALGADSR